MTDQPNVPGIRFEGASKAFGRTLALSNVTLDVPQGSYVGLMGGNGAGKTTLLKLAAGLAMPTGGRVTVAGVDMRMAGPRLRALIGFVSHETFLYADLTAGENLLFHARLFGVEDPRTAVRSAARLLGVEGVLDRPVRALSRGTRQRVSLARALLHRPSVVLLDEPYTGLDEAAAATLAELLDDLHAQERTLVVALHEVARAMSGPERLVVLNGGRVVLDTPASAPQVDIAHAYLSLLRPEVRP